MDIPGLKIVVSGVTKSIFFVLEISSSMPDISTTLGESHHIAGVQQAANVLGVKVPLDFARPGLFSQISSGVKQFFYQARLKILIED